MRVSSENLLWLLIPHPLKFTPHRHHHSKNTVPFVMSEAPVTSQADVTNRGINVHLSKTEGRILYARNLLLILLSLFVGGRALLSILAAWCSATLSPERKFTHFLVGILLTIELVQCVVWFLGMTVAALDNGCIPSAGTLNMRTMTKLCVPLGFITYWLDLLNSLWHAVIAWKVWSWVYLHKPVYVLRRNLIYMTVVAVTLATSLSLVPVFERVLGLTPHSHCFLTTFWKKNGHPTAAFMLDRWILLPICWFAVAGFNCASIYELKKGAQFLVLSAQQLQVRLLLTTVSFCVLWGLMVIPSYLFVRTFTASFLLRAHLSYTDILFQPSISKWHLAMGFVDAICYGFPESLDAARYVMRRCPGLALRFMGDTRTRDSVERSHDSSQWVSMTMPRAAIPGEDSCISHSIRRGSSLTAPRTVLYLHRIFLTTFDKSYKLPPQRNLLSFTRRKYLAEGLKQWLPLDGYHIYGIAVQKSRHLLNLREAIHDYLGGNARYMLAATVELNDAMHTSKTALMLFVRTVDVESGAFHLIGLNKSPVRASHTGTKGLLGLSFRFYDQSIAIIHAHLPTVRQYGGNDVYRARHVADMLHELRIDAEHELFDTHLQYHHTFLLGNLNSRTQGLSPSEMLGKVVESSKLCQDKFEWVRHRGMDWNWRVEGYNWFWRTATGGVNDVPVFSLGPEGANNRDYTEELKERETERHKEERSWVASLEMGLWDAGHQVLEPLTAVVVHAWAWVKDVDKLLAMMRRGYMFSGFHEGPIVFPPTFKWNAGTTAEDFTAPSVVEEAYNTHARDLSLENVTPSYADRILFRSIPGMTHRLDLLAYDALERGSLATLSTHRPVSAAFTLKLDTAYPLALCVGPLPHLSSMGLTPNGPALSPRIPRRHEERTEVAAAMTDAARICRAPISPVRPIYKCPTAPSTFPPLLITVCLSHFRFRFVGFKNNEGVACGGMDSESQPLSHQHHHTTMEHGAEGQSRSREGSEDETKEQQDTSEEKQTQQREGPILNLCPPFFCLPTLSQTSVSSDLSWMSSIIEGEYGFINDSDLAGGEAASASVKDLVEEVVILYPLPCEDPLWCFRHYQALNESLRLTEGCRSPDTTHEKMLHNLHQMLWNPDLEVHDEQGQTQHQEGQGIGHLEMDVLTLAPLPSKQHALIKFLGPNKSELGQGIISVRSDTFEETSLPLEAVALLPTDSSPPSPSLRRTWNASSGRRGSSSEYKEGKTTAHSSSSAAVGMPSRPSYRSGDSDVGSFTAAGSSGDGGPAGRKKKRLCQTVTLSVGGAFRGTVEFACDVKVRHRAKDGSKLKVPEEEL